MNENGELMGKTEVLGEHLYHSIDWPGIELMPPG